MSKDTKRPTSHAETIGQLKDRFFSEGSGEDVAFEPRLNPRARSKCFQMAFPETAFCGIEYILLVGEACDRIDCFTS